jgi:hypothetical protein
MFQHDQRAPEIRAELNHAVNRDQRRRGQQNRHDRDQHHAAADPEGRGNEGCAHADGNHQQRRQRFKVGWKQTHAGDAAPELGAGQAVSWFK